MHFPEILTNGTQFKLVKMTCGLTFYVFFNKEKYLFWWNIPFQEVFGYLEKIFIPHLWFLSCRHRNTFISYNEYIYFYSIKLNNNWKEKKCFFVVYFKKYEMIVNFADMISFLCLFCIFKQFNYKLKITQSPRIAITAGKKT